jgi:hypothetical protein
VQRKFKKRNLKGQGNQTENQTGTGDRPMVSLVSRFWQKQTEVPGTIRKSGFD